MNIHNCEDSCGHLAVITEVFKCYGPITVLASFVCIEFISHRMQFVIECTSSLSFTHFLSLIMHAVHRENFFVIVIMFLCHSLSVWCLQDVNACGLWTIEKMSDAVTITLSGRLSHLVGHYNFPVVVECPTWWAITITYVLHGRKSHLVCHLLIY